MRHHSEDGLLPLASIPQKEGFQVIAVRRDGAEARVAVYVDADGHYTLPNWKDLVGWRRV